MLQKIDCEKLLCLVFSFSLCFCFNNISSATAVYATKIFWRLARIEMVPGETVWAEADYAEPAVIDGTYKEKFSFIVQRNFSPVHKSCFQPMAWLDKSWDGQSQLVGFRRISRLRLFVIIGFVVFEPKGLLQFLPLRKKMSWKADFLITHETISDDTRRLKSWLQQACRPACHQNARFTVESRTFQDDLKPRITVLLSPSRI